MKKHYYVTRIELITMFFLLLIFSSSCKHDRIISDLRIEKNKDTLSPREPITVKLHIENYKESYYPAFYIIGLDDTLMLPFDANLKCGLFKGEFSKAGEKKYTGFVEYHDKTGKLRKENFSFSFFVK